MNLKLAVRTIFCALSIAVASPLFAQAASVVPKNSPATDSKTSSIEEKKGPEAQAQRLDADLNNDGILDAVQTLILLKTTSDSDTKKSVGNDLQKDLSDGFLKARQVKRVAPRRSCMNYMMLSPEEKDRVNQKIQARTQGVFGTRPCDPFVSDMLERPFDNDYIEVPLLPGADVVLRD